MLRHACGYALANKGHDTRALQAWLGHRNIQHTVRYTELAPNPVQGFLAGVSLQLSPRRSASGERRSTACCNSPFWGSCSGKNASHAKWAFDAVRTGEFS